MLILHGKERLTGPWAQVELTSDARLEEVVLHLIRWIAKRDEAISLLFPVESRDLDGVRMLYPNILIRARDIAALTAIRSVMGVQGLTLDGTGVPLLLDHSYVQSLIVLSEQAATGWSKGIKLGTFVRILLGERRMLCGTVVKLRAGIAEVVVSLTTRDVRVRIPVRALLKIDKPRKEQVYYAK